MELYQKIYVDPSFLETVHGETPCEDCHGGDPEDGNWQTAHGMLVKDPSFPDAGRVCGDCHREIVSSAGRSLHYTLAPMYGAVFSRAGPGDGKARGRLDAAMDRHCGTCHASCGQCHVSRPDYVNGGFLAKHLFVKTPSMETTCASCHGGRVFAEYTGENDAYSPDVHYGDGEMACTACHSGQEMHADGSGASDRYHLSPRPACRECHTENFSADAENESHARHGDRLDCRVCHAQAYKNCHSCHVGTDKQGLPYFKCKRTEYGFKIGLNPSKTPSRPYEFVLVRHVPAQADTFGAYGLPLDRFDAQPTWKPGSPHTIVRVTSQNRACNGCHGRPDLFLMAGDIPEAERRANKPIIVPQERVPETIPEN